MNFICVRQYLLILLLGSWSSALWSFDQEKVDTGWSFYFDNDLFALGDRDYDYTGGAALKNSGSDYRLSWLDGLNAFTGFDNLYKSPSSFSTHSREAGFTLFTPRNLDQTAPIFDEHPYASLFFVSYSKISIIPQDYLSYSSGLMLGVLGLPFAEGFHRSLHKLFGADTPRGWQNQISVGGEPTFKYMVSRSKSYLYLFEAERKLEVKTSSEANLGFTSDVGVALSIRYGQVNTPWWSFNPHNAEYLSLGSPVITENPTSKRESYLWTGVGLKYRLYNAILQGQFRDSEVTFERDELNYWLAEFWIGYTQEFDQQWRLSAFLRTRNNEIDIASTNHPVWGGFIISKTF